MTVSHDVVGRPMEILLVEDNLADAGLAMDALKCGGLRHRLTLTVDGIETMAFLRQQGIFHRAPRPDLVLLDLGLPKKDGREVLAEMREDKNLKSIPVVVLTASAGDEDYLKSQLMEVDGYMVKPVDMAKFLEMVRRLRHRWLSEVILPAEVYDQDGPTPLHGQPTTSE